MAGALRLVPVACLVLLVPLAVGHTETSGALAPGSVDISGSDGMGAAFCQRENPAAPYGCGGIDVSPPVCQGVNPIWPLACPGYCQDGSVVNLHCRSVPRGGADYDVSTAAWGLNGVTQYATGSCQVSNSGALLMGPFSFTCGTDRDDDTYVTNLDDSPNDAGAASTDDDGFDDDFAAVSVDAPSVTVNVCFRSDVALRVTTLGFVEDSTAPVAGDKSWDDVVFFFRQDPSTLGSVQTMGAVQTTLTLNAASGCSTVSGHTHG